MKKIKYDLCMVVSGEEILLETVIDYNEANLVIAKKEAYNGQYEIFDDGKPEPAPVEPETEPSVWDELDSAYQEGVDSV